MPKPTKLNRGDLVRIANPWFIHRVGYPMSYEAAREAVRFKLNEVIQTLGLTSYQAIECLHRGMARAWLFQHNFGGPRRELHGAGQPEWKDAIARVTAVRTVYTGIRESPREQSTIDGVDFQPAYLSDPKPHRLLTVVSLQGLSPLGEIEDILVTRMEGEKESQP